MDTVLHEYWRSSASYRVRVALNMLGQSYESVVVDLLKQEQRAPDYLALNPQGFVPMLDIDGISLTQSLAIIEYLDETRAAGFLPAEPLGRARVRALSYAIAMDIHPICNQNVVNHVADLVRDEGAKRDWMRHFIGRGLHAFEAMLACGPRSTFCYGERAGMADFCLIPQLYNARRWEVDVSKLPTILKIEERCAALEPFVRAYPTK